MAEQRLRFEEWANFYVIISAAAATLLGLFEAMFHQQRAAISEGDDTPAVLPTLLFLSGPANAILSMYTSGGTDVGRCSDFS
jgi:hypothetical protein